MSSLTLAPWLFDFLSNCPTNPPSHVRSTIENATGLLQNLSLKSSGLEKVVHY